MGWRFDHSGPISINRADVAVRRLEAGIRDPADAMPESTQGVIFPTMKSLNRHWANVRIKGAGMSTTGAWKHRPPSSPEGDEPLSKRRRTGVTPLVTYLEQRAISLTSAQICAFDSMKADSSRNICLVGHAASGKSVLGELVVATADGPALLLVPTKRAMETAQAWLKMFPNVDVHSHSTLADLLFPAHRAWRMDGRRAARKDRACPQWRGPLYSVIVVDEFQECDGELYWLFLTFLVALPNRPRLILLGDPRQTPLTGYRGGDARFLSLAPTVFERIVPAPWTTVFLQGSLLTRPNAQFINKIYLGGGGHANLKGSGDGPRPQFHHVGPGGMDSVLANIIPLIKGYAHSCALTTRSTKHLTPDHPLVCIAGRLGELGIDVVQPKGDNMHLNTDELRGKVVVGSHNQLQGSHYKLVIVVGDEFRKDDPARLVALTRASHLLVVVQSSRYPPPLPFAILSQYADVTRSPPNISLQCTDDPSPGPFPRRILASEVAHHVDGAFLDTLVAKYLIVTEVAACLPAAQHIAARDSVCTDYSRGVFESVNDLNGMIVTAGLRMRREDANFLLREHARYYDATTTLWCPPG
ncbi:P-loop containing nucleoside triphosphate hydrolase protein [Mycena crocata]|nr:P-loop containing nucleoside triphosphate hydrolase protein [Mycena crocata]